MDIEGTRARIVTAISLGAFSLSLSIGATVAFRLAVFLPPDSAPEFVQESLGMAALLTIGGAVATGVSTVVVYRKAIGRRVMRSKRLEPFLAAASGPLAACLPGVAFLGGTMGWMGLNLLIALALTSSAGFWLILLFQTRKPDPEVRLLRERLQRSRNAR